MVNGVLDKDEVRRNHECVQIHRRTIKNILELTIAGKIRQIPIIPRCLDCCVNCYGMCPIPTCKTQTDLWGSDRERVGYVGGDKTIVREVEAQLNNLNKAFPKAWESKLPAINMYAISVAPRGEDRTREIANRLMWESFIVLQDNQTKDEQQQRAFTNNLLYSKDDTKKLIDVFDENFGEEGTSQGKRTLPQSPRRCRGLAPEVSSLMFHQARASGDTTGRAPWRASYQPTGNTRDDGSVVNQTIQAILEISAKGEDDRWIMPEKHDVNESVTIIEQCTAFGNLNIRVSFVMHRKSGVVVPTTKFGPEVKAGKTASYWERYLRRLVTTLLIFDKRRKADRIVAAYLNKPNLAWPQLYAYICAKTGCLYSAKSYPEQPR